MRFDLVDLRLFVNVDLAGSITAGAARSCMTLASASERICGMEESLGAPLLLRGRRGVEPTPAGNTLLQHARAVLDRVDRMRDDLAGFGAGMKGHVRMLCNSAAMSVHLPDLLSTFLIAHAGVSVDLEERPSESIVDAVRNDRCDLGIVSSAVDLAGLQAYLFRADPLALVVPQGHPLAGRTSIELAGLLDQTFVGLVEPSALQQHVSRHARRLGRRIHYRIRLGSFEAVCRMVGTGVGIGIVPRAVATRCARSSRIRHVPLADAWADRELLICVREINRLSIHAAEMVQHLLSAAPQARRSGGARRT